MCKLSLTEEKKTEDRQINFSLLLLTSLIRSFYLPFFYKNNYKLDNQFLNNEVIHVVK